MGGSLRAAAAAGLALGPGACSEPRPGACSEPVPGPASRAGAGWPPPLPVSGRNTGVCFSLDSISAPKDGDAADDGDSSIDAADVAGADIHTTGAAVDSGSMEGVGGRAVGRSLNTGTVLLLLPLLTRRHRSSFSACTALSRACRDTKSPNLEDWVDMRCGPRAPQHQRGAPRHTAQAQGKATNKGAAMGFNTVWPRAHIPTHTPSHTSTPTRTHAHAPAHALAHTLAHAHAHAHAPAHAHALAHTLAHTQDRREAGRQEGSTCSA